MAVVPAMDEAATAVRFALGTIFFLSGLAKLPNLKEFERIVRDYRIIPIRAAHGLALTIPLAEIGLGLLLLVGLGVRMTAVAVCVLLMIFSIAVVVNLVRGRRIPCGCLGSLSQHEISPSAVVRNVIFIGLAAGVGLLAPSALALDAIFRDSTSSVATVDGVAMLIVGTSAAFAIAVGQEALTVFSVKRRLAKGAASI